MQQISSLIAQVLRKVDDEHIAQEVKAQARTSAAASCPTRISSSDRRDDAASRREVETGYVPGY